MPTLHHEDSSSAVAARATTQSLRLRPFEKVLFGYLALISFLIFLFRSNVESWGTLLGYHALGVAAVYGIKALPSEAGIFRGVKDLYILAAFPFLYSELARINQMIFGRLFDDVVIGLEFWIFRSQPALWLADRVDNRLVTEIFNIGYFSYYFIFIGLALCFFVQNRRRELEHYLYALTLTFLSCYLVYAVFPASGPSWIFPEASNETLKGYFFTDLVVKAQTGAVRAAAFPSSHVAVAVVTWLYARRYTQRFWIWLTPFVALLIPGTFFGKFHFIVDALAGIAWGALLYWVSMKTWKKVQTA